ncbi:inosine-uridine preferring nucleoside hydrolase [Paraliobacillus quinghaiensis]|uniref:Inosine-uridine preferring nucleoside hydrolase n=1 Tax=Paraliobacillus quinghaiensis TaxID=470815 RepID=A0A917WYE0_9BACI|nr:nucleoside hydrolase [Paraliobacillus quinghaiensis]GGM40891.1 inosine-uridine preferring nucleoside hydrolase [Paraliobacillus quinghaiensis]
MTKKVYFNHDAGVDDLVSLFLLTQMEDVELTGVSVIPADGYLEPGTNASRKIIDRFCSYSVEVARSNSRGENPFPNDWRLHTFTVDALPILNESGEMKTPVSGSYAHKHMIETLLKTDGKTTLLFTGPLTDLARALDESPEIEDKIEKLVWMGGTFEDIGNVQEPEHDGTAEWNAFWDPTAVQRVWASGLEIEMVALESTKQVPLTLDVRQKWASLRKYEGVDFLGQCYAAVPPLVYAETNSTYYLWDVLTTAFIGKEELVKTKLVKSTVITEVPSQGRTALSENGREVSVVYDVTATDFFEYITELAQQVK